MRFWLRKIHLWAGVALAAPLLILAISGVLLIFTQQIIEFRLPSIATAKLPTGTEQVGADLKQLDRLAQPLGWNLVRLPEPERPYYEAWLMNDDRAYLVSGEQQFADSFSPLSRPESFIYELHAHFLGGDTGELVVAWVGLFSFGTLMIGLALWFPRWRSVKPSHLKPALASRGKLLKSHMSWGGVFILPIVLAILTGVLTAFPDTTLRVLLNVTGAEKISTNVPTTKFPESPDWQAIIKLADETFDDDQLIYLFKPAPGQDGALYFRTRNAGEWHPNGRSQIYIDASKPALLAQTDARQLSAAYRISHSVFPLHAAQGSASGLWWLMTIAGIAIAITTMLAGLAYASRYRRRKP